MLPRLLTLLLGLQILAASMTGCNNDGSKGGGAGDADSLAVSTLVEDMNDAGGDAKKMAAMFAKGALPSDVAKYKALSLSTSGKPTITGTTATCKVQVMSLKGGDSKTVEWTFEKEGDQWKIKSAPLN